MKTEETDSNLRKMFIQKAIEERNKTEELIKKTVQEIKEENQQYFDQLFKDQIASISKEHSIENHELNQGLIEFKKTLRDKME